MQLLVILHWYYKNAWPKYQVEKRKPVQWNLGSRTPLITNKSVHEQIFGGGLGWRTRKPATTVGDKLGVSAGERELLCNFRSVHIVSVYEHFGWWTASRNELNLWTKVPPYLKTHRYILTGSKNQAQFRTKTKLTLAQGIYCRLHTTNRTS
jgi:hypothetical protein